MNTKLKTTAFYVPVLVALLLVCHVSEVSAERPGSQISLISVTTIAGDAPDQSGLGGMKKPTSTSKSVPDPEASDQTFPANIFGGISAVDYSGHGNEYWFLSDRGPLDGAVDWPCRLHRVRLDISSDESGKGATKLAATILETVFLQDEHGHRFTGLASAFTPTAEHPVRLDPEGLRVSPKGTFYISDEYGPRLMEFSRNGRLIRELDVPAHYQVTRPATSWKVENPQNDHGRQCNRGMEGLAISGDGKRLFGIMQSPLLQDCKEQQNSKKKPKGLNCRMPVFSSAGNLDSEFVYQLDDGKFKLNEILECSDDQLLAIERDGEPGAKARCKHLMLVSTKGATNIAGRKEALTDDLPSAIHPVHKTLLIDLLDPKWHLAGDQMPEKIESLAFGPDLEDGRRLLIVASDNDFQMDNPTVIYAFAIPKEILR